jgi:hypothetical protein
MPLCNGFAPGPHGRTIRHAQKCGALPVFDGYCVVHLSLAGYHRCGSCGAWILPGRTSCDVCSALSGPTQQLDARAHAGDGEGAAREAGDDRSDRRP